MNIRKPILCLDFDGVIHSYSSGWKGVDVIPDPPVPGAIDFILRAVETFTVAIYSSRSNSPWFGIRAMQSWLVRHMIEHVEANGGPRSQGAEALVSDIVQQIQWPTEKPPALVTLDDRAVTFTGTWPGLDELAAFQPWNKRAERERQFAELNDPIKTMTFTQIRDYSRHIRGFIAEIDELPNPGTSLMSHNERELIELLKRIAATLR